MVVSPSAAEILGRLGLAGDVVGIGDYVREPESLLTLPRVGAYNQPSVEAVLELRPDALITVKSDAARVSNRRFRSLGVDVIELDTSTLDGVRASITTLGERLHREEEAARLVGEMDEAMAEVRRTAEGADRPEVLCVVGTDPLYAAGPGSHIDRMIEAAGGVNLLSDGAPYQMISLETVLERMPEVIIDTSDNRPDARRGRRTGSWGAWEFLPAVRKNRVFWVDPELLVIPGIRLPEMTRRIGRMIHPEIFGEPTEADFEETP